MSIEPAHIGRVDMELSQWPKVMTGLIASNDAVSFATNTNWQSYGGETTMSNTSIAIVTTLSSCRSKAPAIDFDSMPNSCRSTSAPKPP